MRLCTRPREPKTSCQLKTCDRLGHGTQGVVLVGWWRKKKRQAAAAVAARARGNALVVLADNFQERRVFVAQRQPHGVRPSLCHRFKEQRTFLRQPRVLAGG